MNEESLVTQLQANAPVTEKKVKKTKLSKKQKKETKRKEKKNKAKVKKLHKQTIKAVSKAIKKRGKEAILQVDKGECRIIIPFKKRKVEPVSVSVDVRKMKKMKLA